MCVCIHIHTLSIGAVEGLPVRTSPRAWGALWDFAGLDYQHRRAAALPRQAARRSDRKE